MTSKVPGVRDTQSLPSRPRVRHRELPDGDAAGVYGEADALGSLNLQTPAAIRDAALSIKEGKLFSLNHPIDWVNPPLYSRGTAAHTVFRTKKGNLDDRLDDFFLQASSQWDGFLHVADPESGHYNHAPLSELGIESWATRGIAGRGILLDIERHVRPKKKLDWTAPVPITVDDLETCRTEIGVEKLLGDVLLIRTGWETGYRLASETHRQSMAGASGAWPGLEASDEMAAYLWDWGVSAVAADNPSLELAPSTGDKLHRKILARLGIPIGELWRIDELADDCERDRRFEFFITSAPLNVRGGVGSPANALAIK